MNEYVSGAIAVRIQLSSEKIYLPDVADLRNKIIKYIDVCDEITTDAEGNAISNDTNGFLNLVSSGSKNIKVNNLSLAMMATSKNNGNKFKIDFEIDMLNSWVEWKGAISNQYLYLVFWFDEPQIMTKIDTNQIGVDSFEIPISSDFHVFFPENRTLYNKLFRNLLLFSPDSESLTPENNSAVTKDESKYLFVTLVKDNFAYIRNVPVYLFNQTSLAYELRLQNIQFDFTNSFLLVAPDSGLENVKSLCFNAVYQN